MSFADGKTARLPLAIALTRRNGHFSWVSPTTQQDGFMFNAVYYEPGDGRKIARRRPGSTWVKGYTNGYPSPAQVAGIVSFDSLTHVGGSYNSLADCIAIGFDNSGNLLTTPGLNGVLSTAPLATALGLVVPFKGVFTARYSSAAAVFAYGQSDGVHIVKITYDTYTVASVLAIPGTTLELVGLESFDTYALLAVKDTSDGSFRVYNSAAGDPLTWAPTTDYFAIEGGAEIDWICASGSLLAVGTSLGLYFYYDAGNPAGSPLSIYSGATQPVRSRPLVSSYPTVAKTGSGVVFLGVVNNVTGVYIIPLNSPTATKLSTDAADSLITTSVPAQCFVTGLGMWGRQNVLIMWGTFSLGTGFLINYIAVDLESHVETMGRFVVPLTTGLNAALSGVAPNLPGTQPGFYLWIANPDNGSEDVLQVLESGAFSDTGVAYPFVLQTAPEDADTKVYKTFGRIEFIGNQASSTHPITVAYSDDDYQTWSTPRTFDLSVKRPLAYNFGASRRRAFQVVDTTTQDVQLEALEMLIDPGTG